MSNAGFYNTAGESAMVSRGYEICGLPDWGYSQYQVQDDVYRNTGASIGWADAGADGRHCHGQPVLKKLIGGGLAALAIGLSWHRWHMPATSIARSAWP